MKNETEKLQRRRKTAYGRGNIGERDASGSTVGTNVVWEESYTGRFLISNQFLDIFRSLVYRLDAR